MRKKPTGLNRSGRIIRKAASLYDDIGWSKGFGSSVFNEYCVRGVMGVAYYGRERAGNTYHDKAHNMAIVDFCRFLYDNGQIRHLNGEIHHWNDGVVKSKEEVVAWMNKFADYADPQG